MNSSPFSTALHPSSPVAASERSPSAEVLALAAHVQACLRARGRGFGLHCLGERLHEVLGPRLVSTVLAATLLMALLAGWA